MSVLIAKHACEKYIGSMRMKMPDIINGSEAIDKAKNIWKLFHNDDFKEEYEDKLVNTVTGILSKVLTKKEIGKANVDISKISGWLMDIVKSLNGLKHETIFPGSMYVRVPVIPYLIIV